MKSVNAKNSLESTHATSPFLSGDKKGSFFSSSFKNHNFFFGPSAIQPKLEIGQPNDKYEREADQVADTVMRMPDNSVNKPAFFKSTQSIIQKQVPSSDAEPQVREGTTGDVVEGVVAIPEVSMFLTNIGNDFLYDVGSAWDESLINKFGLISGGLGIAGGLGLAIYAARNDPEALDLMVSPLSGTVIPPFDFDFFPEALRSFALEVNLDRYDQNRSNRNIMGGLHFDVGRWLPPVLGFGPVDEWNPIGAPSIQPKCEGCEEEEKLQKKSDSNLQSAQHAGSKISSQLASQSGTGRRLPKPVRSEMAYKMGADFSGVNIHTDTTAHKLNRQLGARAFTHGSDIYFNKGEYNPASNHGKRLLAHELTHVVQQQKVGLVLQKQEVGRETQIIEEDVIIEVPDEMTEGQLRQIIHNQPVIGRRLIYRSDEGEHAGNMLQNNSNVSEVYSQISDRHGPVRLHFRFFYIPITGTDGWRVREIEIEVRDAIMFEDSDTVAPNPPPDLQERINRQSPSPPDVNLPPKSEEVLDEIRRIFWDPENATPTDPRDLIPSMPTPRAGLEAVIQNNLRNLQNADAIQRSGADYLGYADALARWATGTDVDNLINIPDDIYERVMGRPLSLEGYRTGVARAIQMISRISPPAQQQGTRYAIRDQYGHTRARIREGLLQQTTNDMSSQLRALMPNR